MVLDIEACTIHRIVCPGQLILHARSTCWSDLPDRGRYRFACSTAGGLLVIGRMSARYGARLHLDSVCYRMLPSDPTQGTRVQTGSTRAMNRLPGIIRRSARAQHWSHVPLSAFGV